MSVPGLVDLLAKRRERAEDLPDDLDDVFARYYAENPDGDGLAVFDESTRGPGGCRRTGPAGSSSPIRQHLAGRP